MSTLTYVQISNDVALIDSRVYCREIIQVDHSDWMNNVAKKHQSLIEQAFGIFRFENGEIDGRGRPEKYLLLTEAQCNALLVFSRNVGNVSQRKIELIADFEKAKQLLKEQFERQYNSTVDVLKSDSYQKLLEYADKVMPGYRKLTEDIVNSGFLIPTELEQFTAVQWVAINAPLLTQRQKICFYKEIASAHRFLIDAKPKKVKGQYQYTSDHEPLFKRVKEIAEIMIPEQSDLTLKRSYYGFEQLTPDEKLLLGQEMTLTHLLLKLGYYVKNPARYKFVEDNLQFYIDGLVVYKTETYVDDKIHLVTPMLIKCVKYIINDRLKNHFS